MSIILTSTNTLDVTLIGKLSELLEAFGFSVVTETNDVIIFDVIPVDTHLDLSAPDIQDIEQTVVIPEPEFTVPTEPEFTASLEIPVVNLEPVIDPTEILPLALPNVIIKSLYCATSIKCSIDDSSDFSVLRCKNPMLEKRPDGFSIFGIGNDVYKYPTSQQGGILVTLHCGDREFDLILKLAHTDGEEEVVIGQNDKHCVTD